VDGTSVRLDVLSVRTPPFSNQPSVESGVAYILGEVMKQLSSMNFDELLALKGKVEAALSSRVLQERKRLTESLQRWTRLK
jgi:hypothetical protein